MLRWSACAVAAILGSVTFARAEAPATTGQTSGQSAPAPQTSSPYWNNPAAPLGDLPAADIRAVPAANANRVRTYWSFHQTLFDLNNAVRVMQTRMNRQPEYVKAVADEKTAYDAMEKAREAALSDLQRNPAYTGLATLHRNVTALIADENDQPKPDPTRLAAMAKLKLQYVKDNRKLEASALERDQAYQDARKTYMAAAARTSEFRDTQALAVATDDSLMALRRDVAEARVQRLTAHAYFKSAVEARDVAIDYALLYRGVDTRHGYGNGYGGYGYGSGYGYGVGPYGLGTVGGVGQRY